MGVLKDILDMLKDYANEPKAGLEEKLKNKGRRYTSLSKRSAEGTLQFPVLVSSSLDLDAVQMVAKALEKNYASFAQTALSMSPFLHLSDDADMYEYLRRFHQNTDTTTDLFDVTSAMRDVLFSRESFTVLTNKEESMYMVAIIHETHDSKVFEDNLILLKESLSDLNMDIGNNKYVPKFNYKLTNVSDNLKKKYNINLEAQRIPTAPPPPKEPPVEVTGLPKEVLKWAQTQKLNELMPTMLTVKIKVLDTKGGTVGDVEFIIGIKTTVHSIKTDEMIINTVNACQNKDKVFNFIRWTTGEISFVKDFILNIGEIKTDIASTSAGASRWWSTLKRRSALSKIHNVMTIFGKNLLPNTTLVLSMEEINYIKNIYGYDLMSPYFLTKIMKTYFLLGFVVVDNSTQVVHFMFDGQESFQLQGFSSLKKEAASDENFKQMLNIIRRV